MSSAKPLIFISYAHVDEPEKPRGEEIQWLSFVMKFLRPAVKSREFDSVGRPPDAGRHGLEPGDRARSCAPATFSFCSSPPTRWLPTTSSTRNSKSLASGRRRATVCMSIRCCIDRRRRPGSTECATSICARATPSRSQSYSLSERNQHMSDAADEIAEPSRSRDRRSEKQRGRAAERRSRRPRAPSLRSHQRPARDLLRAAGRARRGA